MVFQRSLWILLLGACIAGSLIYWEGGDVGRVLTIVLLVKVLLLLLFGGR